MTLNTVVVLGNDARMDYVAQELYRMGYDVSKETQNMNEPFVLILPPVATNVEFEFIRENKDKILKMYSGSMNDDIKKYIEESEIKFENYLQWTELVSENASLTAKGIVKIAKSSLAVLKESHCLVTGYGKCGKAICRELINEGARVDVMVRRKDLKDEIELEGYGYVSLNHATKMEYEKYSYIFNTIPHVVIDKNIIEKLPSDVMLFDIASKPGGIDFDCCREYNIKASLHLGIPGMYFPKEAGIILAKYIGVRLSECSLSS